MPTANEPIPPPPASGHPSPEPDGSEPTADANAQVPLIGNLPDGETAQGAVRPGREQPDGFGG